MRRLLIPIASLALVLPAFASHGRYGSGHGFSVNMDGDYEELTSCSQIHVTYDGRDVPIPRDPSLPDCAEPGCVRQAHPLHPDAHVKVGPSHGKRDER